MVDMLNKHLKGYLGPEFDGFLFATIGVDQRGGQLSVISALARLDLDPWAEAARLARLPVEAAVQKLSSWLSCYAAQMSDTGDQQKDARQLIDLLPKQSFVRAKSENHIISSTGFSNPYAFLVAFFITLSIILMLGMFSAKPSATSSTPLIRSGSTAMPALSMRAAP
jgi:hypothetical protein